MKAFTYNALPGPSRVIFGTGSLSQIAGEIRNIGCSKTFLVTTPGQAKHAESIKSTLGQLVVGLYTNAKMHTPVNVTDEATQLVKDLGADCIVAIGGGSAIGLAKAIAMRTDLPQIAIPTTYAGSEVRLEKLDKSRLR
jgi:maleylacetate reductase